MPHVNELDLTKQLAALPRDEFVTLVYFTRIDELLSTAPATDPAVLERLHAGMDRSSVRAALGCLCAVAHSVNGSPFIANEWFKRSAADAEPGSWLAGWIASTHAERLIWEGNSRAASKVMAAAPLSADGPPWQRTQMTLLWLRFAQGDTVNLQSNYEALVNTPVSLMPALHPVNLDVLLAFYLAPFDCYSAEVVARSGLLRAPEGDRATGFLLHTLGLVLAHCGQLRQTTHYHHLALQTLRPWPAETSLVKIAFGLQLDRLGLGDGKNQPQDARSDRATSWEYATATARELYQDARAALRYRNFEQADRAIDSLLESVAECIQDLETLDARRLVARRLVDFEALVAEVGITGRADEMYRLIEHRIDGALVEWYRGAAPAAHAARLSRALEDSTLRSTHPAPLQPEAIADLQVRIQYLEQRGRQSAVSISADWRSRELPAKSVISFTQARGRQYRLSASPEGCDLIDLGPVDVAEAASRAVRIAASAMYLNAEPDRSELNDAAARLDEVLFAGCSWEEGEEVALLASVGLDSLPWRLLPSLRQVKLTMGRHNDTPSLTPKRERFAVIGGHGLGRHHGLGNIGIIDHYAQNVEFSDPSITLERLLSHCSNFDVVHLIAHGPLDPSPHAGGMIDTVDEPATRAETGPATMADVVVVSSCDVDSDPRLRGARLTWTLLAAGVRWVVSSPLDLDDEAIATVMPELHRLLASGVSPSDALYRLSFDDPSAQVAADSLLAYSLDNLFRGETQADPTAVSAS